MFPVSPSSKSSTPDTARAGPLRSKKVFGSKSRRSFLLLLALALFFAPLNTWAQQTNKRVLILTGSELNRPGFAIATSRIQSIFRDHWPSRVELLYELQEGLTDNSQSQADDEELTSYLKRKYANRRIDLVLVLAASRFPILAHKDPTLFENIPRIFFEYDDEREATNRLLGPNITGVWANHARHRATLDLAFALSPDARKVVVISGASLQDKKVMERVQADFRPYENRAEFSYLTGETVDELKRQLAALDRRSIVVFVSYASDKMGNNYVGPEALSLLAPVSGAPIYGSSETYMGLGVTGGNLLDFEGIGQRIGEMSLRLLAGEKPEQIPQETAPNVTAVDWREMRRWGLSEQRLPPGTVVRYRQPSFWELYKWYAIGFVAAVIIEALLIAWLLFLRVRRRQAEAEQLRLAQVASAEHKRIGEIVSNVPGIVWEAMIDPATKERKTTFISDHLQKMLGYTPKEWLALPGFGLRIMPEEERERATRDTDAVLTSGKKGTSQFRWQAKDGRIVWVESHLSPIVDDNEKVIGLRGVTLDITERKSSEETLRQTEEKDRAILMAIPDLMLLQTRDGVYLDYHAKDSRELFVPPAEFLGKNMRDVLPADLAEKFLRCFERADEMGEPQILEYKLTINETDRWFEARVVRSGENILTLVRDITQRIFIEESIKRNEAQLAGIIGSAMDAIITVDEDQHIMLFNAAAEKIFGCSAAEAIGQPLNRFVPTPFRDAEEAHISSLTEIPRNGFSVASLGSLYGRGADGQDFPVEASISQLELQGNNYYTIILRDVTERVRAEAALRERKEQLSEAQRVAKVGSWEWDPATDTVTWSEELYRIMGRDPSLPPVSYKDHPALYTPPSWARLRAAVEQALKHGTPYELELELIRGDGQLLWTNARGEVLKDGTGRVVKLQGTLQDITERKQSEADLQRAMMEVSRLKNQLQEENIYLREEINLAQDFGEIVGHSDALKHVLFKIEQVAPTETTVLITGETGTGKELVARAIHNASARAGRPMVKVNCAALSPSLIESELFGHEKGAFTGASARKIGRFELANGATIFLDEIGDLPTELQVKLLRVIQEGEFERLGSSTTIRADVRIIAATNRNLDLDVRKGLFREDLWYRLNVFPITVPPLRQRREDIPLLVEHFARRFSKKLGKAITSVSPTTLKSFRDYSWPGNVRELANIIERAVINSHGPLLRIGEDFGELEVEKLSQTNKSLEELERDYIVRILNETGWRIEGRHGAARVLGINPSTLRARMGKLGVRKPGNSLSRSAR